MKRINLSRRRFLGVAIASSAFVAVPAPAKALTQPVVTMTPVGMLMPFAGPTPPEGFMWCDGRELQESEYGTLFKLLGRMYGGDASRATFALPDFRARIPVPPAPRSPFGEHQHSVSISAPSHTHVVYSAVDDPRGPAYGQIAQPTIVLSYVMAVDDLRITWDE